MEKYAWKATILDGKKSEYIRRHNEIWPEMIKVLKDAGISNYSIWISGNDVFGYYECKYGIDFASKVQSESEVVKKWDIYMKDVMKMEMDRITKAQPLLENVFNLN